MNGAAVRAEHVARGRSWAVLLCAVGYMGGIVFQGSFYLGLYLAVVCATLAVFPSRPQGARREAGTAVHGWFEIAAWGALPIAMFAVIGAGWFPWDGGLVVNVGSEGDFEVLPGATMLLVYVAPLLYPTLVRGNSWQSLGFTWSPSHAALATIIVAPLIIGFVANWDDVVASYQWIGPQSAAWVAAKGYYQPGLWEELYYRSFLYRMLRTRTAVLGAATVSSLLFAGMHDEVVARAVAGDAHAAMNLVAIFLLGMAMAFVYERSRSILPCILFHGSVDAAPYLVRAIAH